MFRIVNKRELNSMVTLLEIEAPFVAKKAQAGQFIIFRVDEFSERVPLTIADYDREKGTVTIIFQKVGLSTKLLAAKEIGDTIQDFVGPLGVATEYDGMKKVAVVGGGNVAMDAARTALRLGAEVHIVYRRSETELPARAEEVHHAKEEGIIFNLLTNPTEILTDEKGWVKGMTVRKMELGEPDERGRRKPVGTGEFEIVEIDSVIGAVGQTVDWGTLDVGALKTTKKNTAEADSLTYQTAQPDIFVGGDCYTGPKFAIDAIAAGKEAAISLHR